MSEKRLSIAIIDENHLRAAILEDGLRASGIETVIVIREHASLLCEPLARDATKITNAASQSVMTRCGRSA